MKKNRVWVVEKLSCKKWVPSEAFMRYSQAVYSRRSRSVWAPAYRFRIRPYEATR